MQINERVALLNERTENNDGKYVLYWMQIFKRTSHNHALKFAIDMANERKLPLVVYEGLKFYYPWASDRLHAYILEGVAEKKAEFEKLGITYIFYLQKDKDSPKQTVARICKDAALLVTDDFPCFIIPEHNAVISKKAEIPVYAVDSNGMIPMSKFEKEEYAAYTIRPKIKKLLPNYLEPFKESKVIVKNANVKVDCPETIVDDKNIFKLISECDIDHDVKPSPVYHGGTVNGRKRLKHFIEKILPNYDETRNKPEIDGSSRMSSYLHFGFLSAEEVYHAVADADAPQSAKDSYLEELVVRRELGYNFTRHNKNYESLESLPDWAKKTIAEHDKDERPFIFSKEQIELGKTADELWNAAQRESIETGEVHNYMRMLWGKKFIEWRPSYKDSFDLLIHLNNKYSLDGRNPNSYAGVLWCFGKHDRAWGERAIFGKLRYMSSINAARKFDSKKYIELTKHYGEAKS
ncbi:MAG: deoxyribodipyrimidine photolyase [Pyrinomonadaceae bacterium]|nr:deoxyribodipyrimidine photolyase [Pyrinomonadaceae bacterium]